jgi:hypothetical protein
MHAASSCKSEYLRNNQLIVLLNHHEIEFMDFIKSLAK